MAVIRSANVSDAPALLALYAPYVEQTAITFELEVPSEDEFARRIASTLEHGYPYLVLEDDGHIMGYAYAWRYYGRAAYARSAEVSIYVRQDARAHGVGHALYEALEEQLSRMGVTNLYACIAVAPGSDPYVTPDSMRFHERMGYVTVGHFHACGCKFGRLYDIVWMEKIMGDVRR